MSEKLPMNYLTLGILLFGISIMLTACKKDDDLTHFQYQEQDSGRHPILHRAIRPEIIADKALSNKLTDITNVLKDPNVASREVYNSEHDFTIDTDIANLIEFGEYRSYTFPVSREMDNGLLENVLLSLQSDGTFVAYLIAYDITEGERQQLVDNEPVTGLENKISSTILLDGEWASSVLQRGGEGSCWDFQTITPTCPYGGRHTAEDILNGADCKLFNEGGSVGGSYSVSIEVDCQEFQGGGGYSYENPDDPGYTGNDYGWPETGGEGPYDPNNPDPDPGNGDECSDRLSTGFVDNNGNCIPNTTAPIVSNSSKSECKKINTFLNHQDNQPFKQKLNELSSNANLNLNKEKSVSSFENETALLEREGTANVPEMPFNINPTNKYKAFVHTHPAIGSGTLSVFSDGDLVALAKTIKNNKIGDSFVAFLTTKKGTQYAITINNPTKFLDFFFYFVMDGKENELTDDEIEIYGNSNLNSSNLIYKYFDRDNPSRKINSTDSDNNRVLLEFLNFMEEADAGFTLFDASATTVGGALFETFREIKLKNGQPHRENPCN